MAPSHRDAPQRAPVAALWAEGPTSVARDGIAGVALEGELGEGARAEKKRQGGHEEEEAEAEEEEEEEEEGEVPKYELLSRTPGRPLSASARRES